LILITSQRSAMLQSAAARMRHHGRLTRVVAARTGFATHEVFNQATPLENVNLYTADVPLQNAVNAFGGGGEWSQDVLVDCGEKYGRAETIALAFQANAYTPQLKTHDRFGNRINSVEFHPAYHQLMALGKRQQLPSFAWKPQQRAPNGVWSAAGPPQAERVFLHTARAALPFMGNQIEAGTMCPLTMTYAAVPALRHCDAVAADWLPGVLQPVYDPRDIPHHEKAGLTVGMSMTEKQGGSDVRSNTTVAEPVDPGRTSSGDVYLLRGHKWFTSAPHCDGFLTLAYARPPRGSRGGGGGADQKSLTTHDQAAAAAAAAAGAGPSCFLVPRWFDGKRNEGFQLQRLKDKLGDRSNASSEVEYRGAYGRLIGREGHGVKVIIDMVNLTRLDCTIGSAALVRQALSQALHHTSRRSAFGRVLVEQPLMRNVLADLALDSEAATLLTFRSARGIDDAQHEAREAAGNRSGSSGSGASSGNSGALSRLLTAVAKYFICKSAPRAVYEAMECLGGNGFVEVRRQSTIPIRLLLRRNIYALILAGSSDAAAVVVVVAAERSVLHLRAAPHTLCDGCGVFILLLCCACVRVPATTTTASHRRRMTPK
jgi:putative acyl-CoA dehydrogenase